MKSRVAARFRTKAARCALSIGNPHNARAVLLCRPTTVEHLSRVILWLLRVITISWIRCSNLLPVLLVMFLSLAFLQLLDLSVKVEK